MKKVLILICGLICSAALAMAQDASGTVNSLSTDPQQNQKLTGTMGTTTGQPNDVTPGSANNPSGLVPMTTNMSGAGNMGNTQQAVKGPSAEATKSNSAKTSTPKAPASRNSERKRSQSTANAQNKNANP